MSFTGIPTEYNGVHFRSRIEAKWAAFFDLNGIDWEYEPVDQDGWIPDFILPGETDLYVEVKSIAKFDPGLFNRLLKYHDQIDGEILILGRHFYEANQWTDPLCTSGWLIEAGGTYKPERPDSDGGTHEFIWTRNEDSSLDFCHSYLSYHSRRSGYYEGNPVGTLPAHIADLVASWKVASNTVQWKGRRL